MPSPMDRVIPPLLFGFGAIRVARTPDCVVVEWARELRSIAERLRRGRGQALSADAPLQPILWMREEENPVG